MRRLLNLILFNPVIWLSIGGVLVLFGIVGLYDVPGISARLQQLQQLPYLDDAPAGAVAMFEGRISPETPQVYGEFVSYVQEQYRSCGENSCWTETGRETPPLWLTIAGQTVQIANQDYRFESTEHELKEAPPGWTQGALRSRGFRRNSMIFGIGEARDWAGKRQVLAEFIWAGTRASYRDHLEAYRWRSLWWGSGFLASGLLLSAIGFWQARRFLREVRAEAAAQAANLSNAAPQTIRRKKKQRRERTDV
ncbi:MAG TPA: hypothetical protein VGD69_19360 [Herpetosiphonaceae bacterium]